MPENEKLFKISVKFSQNFEKYKKFKFCFQVALILKQ